MEKFVSFIVLLVSSYLLGITTAHVSLTFPPARKLDLDFLDNKRTKMPCGMPKGNFRTILQAGSKVNVTWHLAYPHLGGFRLELLDKNENFTMKLSDPTSDQNYVTGDPTAQWDTVVIPDQPCEDCTLKLFREAREWKDYGFWSCADISIVKASDYQEDCLGRGTPISGSCTCDKGYWGPRCQYKDECENDSDCGKGKCVDIGGTTLPRKQCFCSTGFHGDRCQLQNKDKLPTPENLQLSSHKKTVLSDRMTLYYSIVSDESVDNSDKEMEFILIVNGTSYGAIGWRPTSLNKSCKSMPAIDEVNYALSRKARAAKGRPQKSNPTLLEPLHMPEKIMADPGTSMNSKRSTKDKSTTKPQPEPMVPSSEPEPEPEPETGSKLVKPTSEPKSEPEGTSEPKSEPEATSEPKSEPEATSEPKSEPEASSEPKSEPEASSEPKSEPEASSEPKSEPEATSEPKSEPEAISEPKSEPEASSEPKSEPEASSEPKSEPEASSEPQSEPEASSEPKSEPEASSEPKSEPEVGATKSALKSKLVSEPLPTPESEPISAKSSSTGYPTSEPESYPEKTSYSETEMETSADESAAAIVYAMPESYNINSIQEKTSPFKLEKRTTSYTPRFDFHAMDCTDIVIGTARGMYSRVRDFYTRDRSSPRLDTIYGGTEDLTSATAWEQDGITTIIFRRKVKTSDPTDHELSGTMNLIWARGQEHGEYVHNPKSGLEKENPSVPNFYVQDELKYHGQGQQRGVTFISFP